MSTFHLVWVILSIFQPVGAHDFHTSIAEVEYKKESKSLQVSLRVFTDDINLALKNQSGIDFYEDFQTDEAHKAMTSYLRRHFALVSQKKKVRLPEYLGCEVELDASWLYFEIYDLEDLQSYNVYNKVLIAEFEDQTNVVNIIHPQKRKSLIFTSKTTLLKYPFKE